MTDKPVTDLIPAQVRQAAMRMLRDVMDDDTETPMARRSAAEALLKYLDEEVQAPTVDVLQMSDEQLIQVIIDAKERREQEKQPVAAAIMPVPVESDMRGTSVAERLAARLAHVPNVMDDPLCQ